MRIIYPQDNGLVAVVTPSPNSDLSIAEIAQKDVPAGVPFVIVGTSELPDFEFHEAWECDFSEPDGYGVGHDAWFEMEAALAPKPTPAPAPGDTAIQAELTANAETQGSNYKW